MTNDPAVPEVASDAYDVGGYNALMSLRYAVHVEPDGTTFDKADVLALLEGTQQIILDAAKADGRDLTRYLPSMDDVRKVVEA